MMALEDAPDRSLGISIGKNKLPLISRIGLAKVIAKMLGIFWTFDGILKMQPQMFTPTFVSSVLQPNLTNQPHFLASTINVGIGLFSSNIFLGDLGALVVELFIGTMLIFFPFDKLISKAGLVVSIVWGAAVWIFGDGLGGILTGSASFYTGAPSSVVIYIIAALFLLFPKYLSTSNLARVAGSVFMLGGLLQLQPTFWASDGITSVFSPAASDSISFISQPATILSTALSNSPIFGNIILAASLFGLGALIFFKTNKLIVSTAITYLLFISWFGQDFGGVLTFYNGTSVDPNTAPVLAAFLLIPILIGYKLRKTPTAPPEPQAEAKPYGWSKPPAPSPTRQGIPNKPTSPSAFAPEIESATLENLKDRTIVKSDLENF